MTEWKTYKLGDIAEVQTGPFGSQLHNKDYALVGSPIVTVEHLGNRHFTTQNLPLVSDTDKARLSKYSLSEGDIVFSRVGSVDRCSYVSDKEVGWLFSGRCLRVRCNREVYPLYIYYYFCLESVKQYIRNVAVGATMPSINTQIMSEIPISLPSLEEQRRIAGILGAIDDKIENNRRINTNLELQAQALYKQWFVDNRKDDWEIKSLSDLMDYQGGSQPPASEFIDKPQDGYVRFVQIRDYASNSHPTYIPIAKKNKLCNKKDIMIARYGASLGRICFGLEGAYNVALAKVKPLENYYREFLRCYLSSNVFYDGINMKGNRAVQAGFNQSDINSFMISCPKQDIFVAFENIVSKILDKRLVLQQENETLATLRDTLLPKLMNGEIKL